ncbi:MAG: hypothetical protein ABJB03_00540 [Rhodoglobus sp.]
MKLIIAGKPYSAELAVQRAAVGDLIDLKEQTATETFDGITAATIQGMFIHLIKLAKKPGFGQVDLASDLVFLRNSFGLAFLCKNQAGERITVEEARRIPLQDLQLDFEDLAARKPAGGASPKEAPASEGDAPQ